jgi:signal transduction histidine kinase
VAESLTNTQKHARASAIEVSVAVHDGGLRIETTDDGIGGAVEENGSGLRGLRARAADLGGTFAVDSRDGRGTTLTAILPLD